MSRRVLPAPLSWGRAGVQMSQVASITMGHIAYRVVKDRIRRDPTLSVARQASLWGTQLCSVAGVTVERQGDLPEEGAMLMSNHRSYSDIIALLSQLPVCFLSKAELASWPILGQAATIARTVYVKRDDPESRKKSRGELARILEAGVSTLVFPEGTTFEGPGIMGFRYGGFQIAIEAGVPVVPVAITYPSTEDAWVGDDTFLRHYIDRFARQGGTTARIAFGPPMRGDDPKALARRAEDWVRAALVRLGEPPVE
ncbi:MAG: lysophospholipid acyltransferase family protein [Bradymonadia bacterium]